MTGMSVLKRDKGVFLKLAAGAFFFAAFTALANSQIACAVKAAVVHRAVVIPLYQWILIFFWQARNASNKEVVSFE